MSALTALLDPSEPTPWPTLEEQIAQSQSHDASSSAQGKGRGAELVRKIKLPACALPSAAGGEQGEKAVELRVWKSSSGSSSDSGSADVYAFEARAVGEGDEQGTAAGPLLAAGQLLAPPGQQHASRTDSMAELSDNSAENRACTLWGGLRLDAGVGADVAEEKGVGAAEGAGTGVLGGAIYFELFPGEEGVLLRQPAPAPAVGARDLQQPQREAVEIVWGLAPPAAWSSSSSSATTSSAAAGRETVLALPRSLYYQAPLPLFGNNSSSSGSTPALAPAISPWVPLPLTLQHEYTLALPSGTKRAGGSATGTAPTAEGVPLKPKPGTIVYRRYIASLGEELTYRLIDSGLSRSSSSTKEKEEEEEDTEDVRLMAEWQNSTRVNGGWRQRSSDISEHREFVREAERAPDRWGLVGCWDGVPWGYVEVYFAKSSNVAGLYEAQGKAEDMGFHALVGEERFRGRHRVRSWMGSAVHLCFLLNPRTERVVSEPRASNRKMVEYECLVGGHVEKLIDLGHKRSALVIIPRERFFQLCPLWPLPQDLRKQ